MPLSFKQLKSGLKLLSLTQAQNLTTANRFQA